ncbi:sensor histidine kinase [Paenibacillus ginsengarvi]|uniref:histidine kinase n=1 Tax=Paenibacillus ginsengarvi TaxID=400777 RepID=A0A3B0C7D2_9BACL|nr:sensor histidine kinase [Paenibacillus ginsengarvi]RKN82065.1 sensor histidine kinase [Paenibacillus ginsengarvi]
MATKSKNSGRTVPITAVLVLLVCLTGIALQLFIAIYKDRSYIYGNPFWDGDLFNNVQVQITVTDIAKYYAEYAGYEQLSDKEKVDEETIRLWREQFDALAAGAIQNAAGRGEHDALPDGQVWANTASTSLAALQQRTGKWMSDEWDKLAEQVWQTQLQENTKLLLADKNSEYNNLKRAVTRVDPFLKYTIKDSRRQMTFSNTRSESAGTDTAGEETVHTITFPMKEPRPLHQELNDYFKQHGLEGSFTFYAIAAPVESAFAFDTIMAKDYIRLLDVRKQLQYEMAGLATVLAAVALLLLHVRKHREEAAKEIGMRVSNWQRRIPVDLRVALLAAVPAIAIGCGRTMYNWGMHFPLFSHVFRWALLSLLASYVLITISDAIRLYRHAGTLAAQRENAYFVTLFRLARFAAMRKALLLKSALLFAATVLFGLCVFAAAAEFKGFVLLSVLYIAVYVAVITPYCLKRIGAMNIMAAGIDELAAGRLNMAFEGNGTGSGGVLSHMIHQLSNMRSGLQAALDSQLKSEKLKSELISNVSHDLKTPLTSMINYVGLLKQEVRRPSESERYIAVLEAKTKRLKELIDDLFEISQLSSGTVVPVIERVDVAALLQQTLAELEDKIEASGLQFRVQVQHPHLYARLDGKKTWRVFENLIHNTLRYSLPNTRVHIGLLETDEHIVLRIHNVSAYEITVPPNELFERSKRGDVSRHTEGSGLGLAIAKSIVELQGGRIYIDIEGDYFKVTVELLKDTLQKHE